MPHFRFKILETLDRYSADATRKEHFDSKANTFHEPTTYEPHDQTSSEPIITFARQEYG